jgi:hypothetical protein
MSNVEYESRLEHDLSDPFQKTDCDIEAHLQRE